MAITLQKVKNHERSLYHHGFIKLPVTTKLIQYEHSWDVVVKGSQLHIEPIDGEGHLQAWVRVSH